MNKEIYSVLRRFDAGCDRADGMRHLYEYLCKIAPPALDCDDILRSSVVMAVSAFDLFMHELFRVEVLYRVDIGKNIIGFNIPFNYTLMEKEERAFHINIYIKKTNSFKSFVAPDKIAECF